MKQQSLLLVLILILLYCRFSTLLIAQTTYVVINTNDSGAGSLRQLIADAASGDIITFSNEILPDTITLTTGEIQLSKDITIQGPGETMLTISGNNNSQIFKIPDATPDYTINIFGITFSDGISYYGGSIQNYSDELTLEFCTFTNNEPEYGGGISNHSS